MFQLHERLEADTILVADLALCKVLLMNDSQYPWLILVPRENDTVEITDLSHKNRQILMEEICQISDVLESTFHPDKVNVAALGNIVPQLHVHVVARFKGDVAWPGPIWGKVPPKPYGEKELAGILDKLKVGMGY